MYQYPKNKKNIVVGYSPRTPTHLGVDGGGAFLKKCFWEWWGRGGDLSLVYEFYGSHKVTSPPHPLMYHPYIFDM
jgi:hypothetical protein